MDMATRVEPERGLAVRDCRVEVARPSSDLSTEEPAECEARVERERAIDQRRHRAEVLAEIGQYHGGDGEDARIVARLLQCPVGVIDALQSVRIAVVAPPVTMQLERAQRGPGQREPGVRVAGDRPLRRRSASGISRADDQYIAWARR